MKIMSRMSRRGLHILLHISISSYNNERGEAIFEWGEVICHLPESKLDTIPTFSEIACT
jgi:hypothetical protein